MTTLESLYVPERPDVQMKQLNSLVLIFVHFPRFLQRNKIAEVKRNAFDESGELMFL